MTINVTQQDIKDGQQKRSQCCPVALAIKRALPYHHFCGVTLTHVSIVHDCSPTMVPLPLVASVFIMKYDRRGAKAVKPFHFQLDFEP